MEPRIARHCFDNFKECGDDLCVVCENQVDGRERSIKISPCSHLFCGECLEAAGSPITCSACDYQFEFDEAQDVLVDEYDFDTPGSSSNSVSGSVPQIIDLSMEDVTCTKIQALVQDLLQVRQTDPDVKSIIFSQWTQMLRLVETALIGFGFQVARLEGCMTRQQRFDAMKKFRTDSSTTLFLVSLKTGGVGLNLVRASRVYLLEPYWNPAVEQQAVDRVHRLGQTRPVTAIRFIVKDTIEESMLKLQERKTQLAKMAFNEGESKKRKRATKEEMRTEKLLSLKMLFK